MQREEHPHDHTTHGHDMSPAAQAVHDPVAHGPESAPAAHTTHPSHDHTAPGHDKHAGHTPGMFRERFGLSLLLTLPILYFEAHVQGWFGYQAVQFPGVAWVQPLLSAVLYVYGGGVFVRGAVGELRARQPGMMTLIGLAISVAFLYSVAVSVGLLRGLPLYWELATLIVIMLLGHWIEMASIQGASRALEHLAALVPADAHRLVGERVADVPVSDLRVGERVLIRPGEQMPVDGVVLDGASSVNEAFLTGESRPVPKETGSAVIAGAVNGEGALVVEVQRTGDATTVSQIRRLVEEAQQSRSRFQALADRAAFWLTVVALGAGALTLAVWLVLGVAPEFALTRMVAVMVIACPHALGLAIPLVTVNATAMSAQHGILVRNREAFERARAARVVAFDKTGTLTEGQFGVRAIYADRLAEAEALKIAAALESRSEHPLAAAVVRDAGRRDLTIPQSEEFRAVPGRGVEGRLSGMSYRVGRPEWAVELGLEVRPALRQGLSEAEARGESVIALMDRDQVLALVALADQVRPSGRRTLNHPGDDAGDDHRGCRRGGEDGGRRPGHRALLCPRAPPGESPDRPCAEGWWANGLRRRRHQRCPSPAGSRPGGGDWGRHPCGHRICRPGIDRERPVGRHRRPQARARQLPQDGPEPAVGHGVQCGRPPSGGRGGLCLGGPPVARRGGSPHERLDSARRGQCHAAAPPAARQ
jgi:P-type Cu2+ transporter